MSKFKVGDKVKVVRLEEGGEWQRDSAVGEYGVVRSVGKGDTSWVSIDGAPDYFALDAELVLADEPQAVPVEMADLKVGDRVRIVLEAEVDFTRPSSGFGTARNAFEKDGNDIVSLGRLEPAPLPLPTEPGTVFRALVTHGGESGERTVFVKKTTGELGYSLASPVAGKGFFFANSLAEKCLKVLP